MVKINLLAEGKRAAAVRKTKKPGAGLPADLGQILLVGVLVLSLLGVGAMWWLLSSELSSAEQEVRAASREVEELAPIIKEVEDYEAKKAELEHKIAVISDLKANQQGPVRVMDMISQAVPELLWLTELDMSATQIRLSGRAFNNNAVAAFTENLDEVPEFQEPVFKESKKENSTLGDLYSFSIDLGYQLLPLATQDQQEDAPEGAGTEAAASGG